MLNNYYLNKYNWVWDYKDILEHNDKEIFDSYKCGACDKFLYNLKYCKSCLYVMCYYCWIKINNKDLNCKHCKAEIINYWDFSKTNKSLINQIKVHCILKEKGCKKIISLEDHLNHLVNDCDFAVIKKYDKIFLNLKYDDYTNTENEYVFNFIKNIKIEELEIFKNQKIKFKIENDKLIVTLPVLDYIKENKLENNYKYDKKNTVTEYFDSGIYQGESLRINKLNYGKIYYSNNNYFEGFFDFYLHKNGYGLDVNNSGVIYRGNFENHTRSGLGEEIISTENKGEYYFGNFHNNERSGYGYLEFEDGNKYEGNFKSEKCDGHGVLIGNDNTTVYEGNWELNKINGKFIHLEKNKSIYIGDFKDNVIDGYGILIYDKLFIYKGHFNNKKRHGYGEMYLKNGDIYKGNWVNNLKEGKGEFYSNDKMVYKGNYIKGLMAGQGELKIGDKLEYKGNFTKDEMNGYGEIKENFGEYIGTYKGNFIKNKKNGYGEFFFSNGDYYKGNWDNNKINGKGEYKFYKSDFYKGSWENFQKKGYGEYYYNYSGNVYKGNWDRNRLNGYGELFYKNGDVFKGNYLDSDKHGKGEYHHTNHGEILKCTWVKDEAHGYGEYYFPNGNVIKGQWVNGDYSY